MVDGGMDYIRRSMSGFEESLDIVMDKAVVQACIESVLWCQETGRNPLGIVCAMMRALRDSSNLDVSQVRGDFRETERN